MSLIVSSAGVASDARQRSVWRALLGTLARVWTSSGTCFNRPKGEERTAQGFSPGENRHNEIALKGRPTWDWRATQAYVVITFDGLVYFAPNCARSCFRGVGSLPNNVISENNAR
jgi:hypothetical protein